jgi:hypothetical protein
MSLNGAERHRQPPLGRLWALSLSNRQAARRVAVATASNLQLPDRRTLTKQSFAENGISKPELGNEGQANSPRRTAVQFQRGSAEARRKTRPPLAGRRVLGCQPTLYDPTLVLLRLPIKSCGCVRLTHSVDEAPPFTPRRSSFFENSPALYRLCENGFRRGGFWLEDCDAGNRGQQAH